jgi:Zinc carboxypeptidase
MQARHSFLFALLLALTCGVSTSGAPPGTPQLPGPQRLGDVWYDEHLPLPLPPLMRHADVVDAIERFRETAPGLAVVEQIGVSVEGRSINYLRVGRGPLGVLLWSQMHGDEPTATAALFDVLEYFRRHRDEPAVVRMLDRLTLHIVPMLNPDGAERFQRRNAQGIDINRDALALQTPEGRALKRLRDRTAPEIGFNLHNQNWRTSVGNTGRPAAISLLAVAYDEARSDNPGRILAKKVCAVVRDAVDPLAPGMVARYDDEFEVRAFGDNLTRWGTSVVLIESGPYPGSEPDLALVRINYVALLTALDALASGQAHQADPSVYETLPVNTGRLLYTLITNATVIPGTGVPPFVADVGFSGSRVIHEDQGGRRLGFDGQIDDLGDLRVYGALETVDARGLTLAPLWRDDLEEGEEVTVPRDRTDGPYLLPGQPAAAALLRPLAGSRYRVERILRVE